MALRDGSGAAPPPPGLPALQPAGRGTTIAAPSPMGPLKTLESPMLKFLVPLVLASSLLLGAGCADDNVCEAGSTCACSGAGACDWTCDGAACTFTAASQGTAVFNCASGKCPLTNSSQGDVTLNCAGGGCTATTTGQGDLTVNCSGGGCTVACNGQGLCTINGCPTCACTPVLTSECVVN